MLVFYAGKRKKQGKENSEEERPEKPENRVKNKEDIINRKTGRKAKFMGGYLSV